MTAPHFQRISAASVAVLRDDGAVLLQLRDPDGSRAGGGLWAFPGGKLLPGEDPESAARRELREETSLHAGPLVPLGINEFRHGSAMFYIHVFGSLLHGSEGDMRCLEGLELRFVSKSEARALTLAPGIEEFWDRAQRVIGEPKRL